MAPKIRFSDDQVTWIVYKYGELKSISMVMRAFRLHFHPTSHRPMPSRCAFVNLIKRFESNGGNAKQENKGSRRGIPDKDVKLVEQYFLDNKESHLREASRVLGMSVTKIWIILRKVLRWKAYTPHVSACLSQANTEARRKSAEWFLAHDSLFFEEKVIWTDEKYFVLNQGPNKSINKIWAPSNPYVDVQCKTQSQQKIMCWVGLYAGKVIGPFWIETKMDNHVYNDLMREEIWPQLRQQAQRKQLWYMQDGATCHTTENNLSFLKQKFSGRLISNKSEVPWPPSSPDCNPLDFFFWGYVMQHVYRIKPTSIADLKAVVEDFVESIDPAIIRKACASARKRFEMMMLENGGRFEHRMTALKPLLDGDH